MGEWRERQRTRHELMEVGPGDVKDGQGQNINFVMMLLAPPEVVCTAVYVQVTLPLFIYLLKHEFNLYGSW